MLNIFKKFISSVPSEKSLTEKKRSPVSEEADRNRFEVEWWIKFIFKDFDSSRNKSEIKFLKRFKNECWERWLYICRGFNKKPKDFLSKTILDVGNGPCGILNFITLRHKVGIDPNNILYKKNGILYNLKEDIVFIQAGAESIPLLNESFDIITCINALDHTNNPKQIIEEIKRLLKPGGIFFLSVDTRKEKETSLVHPHAISGKSVIKMLKPLSCSYKREDRPCYDQHPTNKRFDGWFYKKI